MNVEFPGEWDSFACPPGTVCDMYMMHKSFTQKNRLEES